MASWEVHVIFEGETDPVVIRDSEVIKKIPVIVRAIEQENSDWEKEGVQITDPIFIPFDKKTGEFFLSTIQKYEYPSIDVRKEASLFPEANEMSLEKLKKVIELASFFECREYMDCIGLVIAKKLDPLSLEEFTAFMGVSINRIGQMDEDSIWMHPPVVVFERDQDE
uniref:Skp1_POZ domain-containing protein n=1 Tax=Caenorhabditis tropicalis TaxID=1561998 RepID=A0A1I7UNR1_9PELO